VPSPPRRADRTVVLSVGGSVLSTGEGGAGYFGDLADLLRRLSADFPMVVTTGGGTVAREYIDVGRRLGLTEVELDEVGIEVTRIHARLLAARIGPPTPAHPPTTVPQATEAAHRCRLVVLGGTEPGHTTDGVAALLATRLRAVRLVNATRVDGIYDRDPGAGPGAQRYSTLAWPDFRAMVAASTDGSAGQRFVFDRLGADVLARAKIPLRVADGRDLPNLEAALRGEPFEGTTVR
jgi:uridylate kinase